MKKNILNLFIKFLNHPLKSYLKVDEYGIEFTILNVIQVSFLLVLLFAFTMPQEVRCQHKSFESSSKIRLIEKDPQSGLYKVEPVKLPTKVEMKSTKQRFDPRKFEKEISRLKKISDQHDIYKRLYETQQQAEKEQSIRNASETFELERIKLFGKPTVFYQAPFVPKHALSNFLNKTLVSNVLINGKTHDTISIHDPFKLTFSFAANFVSAVVNIYFDLDNNGAITENDVKLIDNGLVMDNDDYDEDQAYGLYK